MIVTEQILKKYNDKVTDLLTESLDKDLYKQFVLFAIKEIEEAKNIRINPVPKILLTKNKSKTQTLGHNDLNNNEIVVFSKDRMTADILRTLAHELVHSAQKQLGEITPESGKDGSPQENEANALAGVILRKFGRANNVIYDTTESDQSLNEVGDLTTNSYPYKLESQEPYGNGTLYQYNFVSEKQHNYVVYIAEQRMGENFNYRCGFGVTDVNRGDYLTNENTPLRIISTAVSVLKDFISKIPDKRLNISVFSYNASLSMKNGEHKDQRSGIYIQYLKKNLTSDFTFEMKDGDYVFYKNTPENKQFLKNTDSLRENKISIKEIADTQFCYKFKEIERVLNKDKSVGDVVYQFNPSRGMKYLVTFARSFDGEWDIAFSANGSWTAVTNQGNGMQIISTVMTIIKHFLETVPKPATDHYCLTGVYKKDEDKAGPSKRTKIYYEFCKRRFGSHYNVKMDGNDTVIEPKEDRGLNEVLQPTTEEYGCLMLNAPIANWEQTINGFIDSSDVVKPNDYPHITVAYGFGPDIDLNPIQDYINQNINSKINVLLKNVSLFEQDDCDVVKIEVESEDLTKLNQWINQNYQLTKTFDEYNPHITLAFVKGGCGQKYLKTFKSDAGNVLVCNTFRYSDKYKNKTEFGIENNFSNSLINSYLTTIEKTLRKTKY